MTANRALALLLALAVLIAYAPLLSAPFLSDDYIHLTTASVQTGDALIRRVLLAHPGGGGGSHKVTVFSAPSEAFITG